jgi:hypothetical protein
MQSYGGTRSVEGEQTRELGEGEGLLAFGANALEPFE